MKPPKKIKIGPYDYTVTTAPEAMDRQGQENSDHLDGFSNCARQVIGLHTTTLMGHAVGEDYRRSTLLHEILHQCIAVAGADIPEDVEERAVRAIEGPLYQTLRENPDLLAYLTS